MQASRLFRVDLAKVRGKGAFRCPRCGVRISPDDRSGRAYSVVEALMREDEVDAVELRCNRCECQILLTGFRSLSRV